MTRNFATALAGAALAACLATVSGFQAAAQDVTLRMHHHLAPQAIGHRLFLEPWAKKIEAESNGRIKIEIFPAMQLGGTAADLYSQVRDGVVDLAWTLPGYTSGLFPMTEVFELPFVTGPATATSPAVMEFYDKYLQKEWSDVRVLALHAHAPGHIHTASKPVRSLEDLKGMKIRAPSRTGVETIEALGAVPVGMPVPQVYEALSRGVVEGTLLPWTIMGPFRIYEVTDYAIEADIVASTFVLMMNKASYDGLPDDLKKVIDDNSGMELARKGGEIWQADEAPAREKAVAGGTEIIELSEEQLARWKEATQPVIDAWVQQADKLGYDGKAALAEARALIDKYSQ